MNAARCSRCIIPSSLPGAQLDEHGVCQPCRAYEAAFGNWETVREQRRTEFEELLRQVRRKARPYDCVIPLSGGKDSTYALYVCSKVYGMKCLCVTLDNGFLSDFARSNIRNALQVTGSDHLMYTVNRDHLLRLYRLFLAKTGDFCSVCMRGIGVCTTAARKAFDVPLAVNGGGRRVAYLNMFPEVFQYGDESFVRNVLNGEPLRECAYPILASPPASGRRNASPRALSPRRVLERLLGWAARQARRAVAPKEAAPSKLPAAVGIFDYLDVAPDRLRQILEQEMGWTSPSDRIEHMDCLLHEMPFYMHIRKFPQLTPHTFYRSGMVRRGLMSRDEALHAEEAELARPEVPAVLRQFLTELQMSEEEFNASVGDWRKLDRFRHDTSAARQL